jgi:hypothetical protein
VGIADLDLLRRILPGELHTIPFPPLNIHSFISQNLDEYFSSHFRILDPFNHPRSALRKVQVRKEPLQTRLRIGKEGRKEGEESRKKRRVARDSRCARYLPRVE